MERKTEPFYIVDASDKAVGGSVIAVIHCFQLVADLLLV